MTAQITASQVKQLRDATQAGMMDAKKALVETNGDFDAAVTLLREKGIAKAGKLAGRGTSEGVVDAYVHGNGRIGVLVEVGCNTDFVANNPEFREFAHEVALQISASPDTQWISREDVPEAARDAELEIYRAQAADKPENIRDRIAQGKLDKWYQSVCLLEQPYIRDSDKTIEELRAALAGKMGENVEIKRFARFERGA